MDGRNYMPRHMSKEFQQSPAYFRLRKVAEDMEKWMLEKKKSKECKPEEKNNSEAER